MLELREHYAREVTRCEGLLKQALDQLNHVEALLSIWSNSTDVAPSTSSESNSSPQQQTIRSSSQPNPNTAADAPISSTTTKSDNITQLSLNWVEHNAQQVSQIPNVETEDKQTADTSDQPLKLDSIHSVTSSLPYQDIPMLPEYADLTRTEAIQKLLLENVGTVCHIGFIVRKLYGELKPDIFKVVKYRLHSTLSRGRESNKWFGVPNQPGCYTMDLSLIPTSSNSSELKENNKKFKNDPQPSSNTVSMVEPYKGQFLIDALTSLFKQNSDKVFNLAEIIQAIYGELNTEQFIEVKPKVLKELSRGYRTGRFSKVPEQIGLYTWDANLITETS